MVGWGGGGEVGMLISQITGNVFDYSVPFIEHFMLIFKTSHLAFEYIGI